MSGYDYLNEYNFSFRRNVVRDEAEVCKEQVGWNSDGAQKRATLSLQVGCSRKWAGYIVTLIAGSSYFFGGEGNNVNKLR